MSRRTILIIRWSVFVAACAFLWLRLFRHGDLEGLRAVFTRHDASALLLPSAMLILLMLLNWGLEAMKWRLLIRHVEPISLGRAFKATIAGTSIGAITPNRVGEFVGRVLFLAPENRIPASFATAVGSIAQFTITILCGSLAWALAFAEGGSTLEDPLAIALFAACMLMACAVMLLYLNPGLLRIMIGRLPVLKRWVRQAEVLDGIPTDRLLIVLGLSFLRYFIFSVQFIMVLGHFTGVQPERPFVAIAITFLVSTLIPTVMLTELGVRGSVAMAVISAGPEQDRAVFVATTLLWLLNVALPALAGSIILLVARIRSSRE